MPHKYYVSIKKPDPLRDKQPVYRNRAFKQVVSVGSDLWELTNGSRLGFFWRGALKRHAL